jgi:hypothetical protein
MSRRFLALTRPRVHHDALDWARRVVTNSGSVSQSTLRAVSAFCDAIDRAAIRDRFYRLNLFCGTGTQYGNTTDTNNNFVSGDYNETGASGGLNGNGSTKYLETGLNPYSAGLAETDLHTAGYFKDALNASGVFIGCVNSNASKGLIFHPAYLTLGMYVRFGGLSNSGIENGSLSARNGFLLGVRRPGGVGFRNGSNINATSVTTGSQAWASASDSPALFVFARNDVQATPTPLPFAGRCQAYSIGKSVTDQQAADFHTAMQSLQTTLSRNV